MFTSYIVFGRRITAQLTFAIGISLVVVFSLIPAVGILVISFTDIRSLPFLPVRWIGLENYRTFFGAAQLGYNIIALRNTFVFAFAVTILQNVIALLIAVLLNQRLAGRNFARAVVFLPTILGGDSHRVDLHPDLQSLGRPRPATVGRVRHLLGVLRRSEPGHGPGHLRAGVERHRSCGGDLPGRAAGDSTGVVRGGRHRRRHLRPAVAPRHPSPAGPGCHRQHPALHHRCPAELPVDLRADRSDQPGHPGAQPGHLHPGLRRRPGRHRAVPGLRRRHLDGAVRHRRGGLLWPAWPTCAEGRRCCERDPARCGRPDPGGGARASRRTVSATAHRCWPRSSRTP